MKSSEFSDFILNILTEVMNGIAASYIQQEENIIELLKEYDPNIDDVILKQKYTEQVLENSIIDDITLSEIEVESLVNLLIEKHKTFGNRLFSQSFPRLLIDTGELNAKFIFGSTESEADTNESKSKLVTSTKNVASTKSFAKATIKFPQYASLINNTKKPSLIMTPISVGQVADETTSSEIVSEIKVKFRTVYDNL